MASGATIDLETGWAQIKTGAIERLIAQLQSGLDRNTRPFSHVDFMATYRVCYFMCTQRPPYNFSEQLYERHGQVLKAYLKDSVLESLRPKHDAQLLQGLADAWERHGLMDKWMGKFFRYLNKYYVEHKALPTLQEAATRAFKDVVFAVLKVEVARAVCGLINKERDGEQIDRSLIKRCVEVFEAMGEGSLDVYEDDFQAPLLRSAEAYYRSKAGLWAASDPVPVYLEKVEAVLLEEAGRVQGTMLPSSEEPLLRALVDTLLARQSNQLLENETSGLRALLRLADEKKEDLARLYRLFSRVPDGLANVAVVVREHVKELGLAIVKERELAAAAATAGGGSGSGVGAAAAAGDEGGAGGAGAGSSSAAAAAAPAKKAGGSKGEDPADPAFVQALLELHTRASGLVAVQFAGNPLFQKAVKDAFEVFINKEVPGSRYTNAELIASFADRVLKPGADKLSDEQIEDALEKVVSLFTYINDKDVFGEIYRNQLAKRLLNQRSVSNDAERSMISKLKLRCGAQYTSKLEGMLNDLTTAETAAAEFKTWLTTSKKALPLDFSVQVLTTGWWPTFPTIELQLPSYLTACEAVFKEYYAAKTQHRRIAWVHSSGTASVRALFGPGGKSVYDLQVAALQAAALVLFNDRPGPLSLGELTTLMGCDGDVVKRTMHSLSCGKIKVLTKTPEGNSIGSGDVFAVNEGFSCPLRKVRIPMASLEESHNPKKVEEDRSHTIEACIVRIMKTRKTLNHNTLTSEVMQQLLFFKPNPKVIKKRIEHLIEREYLERDPSDTNVYRYLA